MKLRIRASITWVIEGEDELAILSEALGRCRGMDPEVRVLGPVKHETLTVNSVGQGTSSTMR